MMGKLKEAIPYYEKSFAVMKNGDVYASDFAIHYKELSECYEKTGDYVKSLAAFRKAALINDSVSSKNNIQKSTELTMNYEFDKKQQLAKIEQDKKDGAARRTKTRQYFIIAALGIVALAVLVIALIQFRNNKQKQKANLLLERQKHKVETTLAELKLTQAKLIQSEKMASLGELTAGIAHEIQNTLNFVNNFAEVSNELIEELQEERHQAQGIRDEQMQDEILNDIKQNLEKINHHGKRADAIVKGMLMHSTQAKGVKEPTDINALCDEYLRLSYHGWRSKDKNFNAELKTDFDAIINKINIVPQDMAKVLLNLFNNAFYAVNEKKKSPHPPEGGVEYQPTVTISTKFIKAPSGVGANSIYLTVSDNGDGIPQKNIDKIFQPFFTTKPTGQGTGLGLSLAYDIITKEHNGTIEAVNKEGKGVDFIIQIPAV
jgi:signal transduction histidine kinase